MKDLSKRVLNKLLDNDFTVTFVGKQREEYVAEIETYSPAGEDVLITIWYDGTTKDFIREFARYADDFDAEEHAAGWYGANNGEPDSLRELLDDADAIKTMLCDMSAKLSK